MLTRWPDIFRLVKQASRAFKLNVDRIEPMTNMQVRYFADCDELDSKTHACAIRLRVHVIGKPKVGLKWATVVHYLAHELAHCKMFELYGPGHKHSRHFYQVMREVLDYWRSQGWEGF